MKIRPSWVRLTPLRSPPKPRPIGALDIEGCGGENGFKLGVIITRETGDTFHDPERLVGTLKSRAYQKDTLYAHNLNYDLGVLLPYLGEGWRATFLDRKALWVRVEDEHRHGSTLRDSLNLLGHLPLSAVGEAIGLPKLPSTYDEPYCLRDAQIVYEALGLFQKELLSLGGEMKGTLASTALDLFRRQFLDQSYRTPFPFRNHFARGAFYGGRTEVIEKGHHEGVNLYDFNSLYPYVMWKYPYPDTNYLHGPTQNMGLGVIMEKEGISDVNVRVRRGSLGSLPFRWCGSLYFPTGEWRGCYPHNELRWAASKGVEITKVWWTGWSERVCRPFRSYVSHLYQSRCNLQSSGDKRELIYKLLLNGLFGKFGQRDDAGLATMAPVDEWWERKEEGGWDILDIGDESYGLKTITRPVQLPFVNLFWAAYISAYARMELFDLCQKLGDDLIYMDTDAVITTRRLPTSPDLGGLKAIYEGVAVDLVSPKAYMVHFPDGEIDTSVKGVPKAKQEEYLLTGKTSFQRPLGVFEAAQRGEAPSLWIEIMKMQEYQVPKRHYYGSLVHYVKRCPSRPLTVEEVMHLSRWHPPSSQELVGYLSP